MERAIILDELKSLLLHKFGINTLNPSHCKFIANEIKNLTNKNISETTVKRVFGFASVKHNFSQYTLTLLADFKDEIRKQIKSNHRETSIEKNTLSRKFSEKHFDSFLSSAHNFTCFMSQDENEKTILFAQLAERLLSDPAHKFSSLLFLNAHRFLCDDFGVLNISSCIKNELGIEQSNDLIKYVDSYCKHSNSTLVIFIDDFNEPEMKHLFKRHFFKRLHDFIEEIENSHIKLVISLKSIDWVKFIESKAS
ncbi:hypothetical protein [Pedobacter foliorum]|uniref:hypothetical protein n=1 Tax=Pedobacter foliorum TaxID=2739058 RepID=UPI001565EAA3|nr:hypothetical protein [Pedobacter foliorum]NRF39561.1 hypothetical protein [Pedobacter foliorum]